jgi:hypothetical protein
VTEPRDELVEDIAGDAMAALIPMGGTLGKRFVRSLTTEWRRNTSNALGVAEEASGLSREDFAGWIKEDVRAIPLYLKVLWAAGMNGHDQTLRAMGAVLGSAAQATARGDDEAFEEAELALRAMSDLTPRHFRVLRVLNEAQVVTPEGGEPNYGQFTPDHVASEAGMREEVAHQCLINLAGAGLATTLNVLGGMAYPITDLGRAVIMAATAVTE